MTQGEPAEDVRQVLETVEHSALRLLSGFRTPPARLQITVGTVTVAAEWPSADGARPMVAVDAAPPVELTVPHVDAAADDGHYVCAPTVGVFYRAPQPGDPPFVDEGDVVVAGQQLGIVEAMKLMIPVTADAPGTVVKVLKDDEEAVEYGERLFALGPADNG